MSILGLTKQEIDERFQDVLDFAEIGDAIDAPLQSYSSGMAARLGFASAIHTEPDILLVDEVLAVGDVRFRGKCTRKLTELRDKGVSFIFVSHNSMAILSVCASAIYLKKGKLITSGKAETVMNRYEQDLFLKGDLAPIGLSSIPPKTEEESSGLDITDLSFRDNNGNSIEELKTGDLTYFVATIKSYFDFEDISLRLEIKSLAGDNKTILFLSGFNDKERFNISPGSHEIILEMPYLCLRPGMYIMNVNIRQGSMKIFDTVEFYKFCVISKENMSSCEFYQPRSWKIDKKVNVNKKKV